MQNQNSKHEEGKVAKAIEEQTAKIPSDVYLWAAVGSIALSVGCFTAKNKHASLFFGQWVPTFLILGLYNKLVKVAGHDKQSG
jgi:FtsH-binding integral membrane protein